MISPRLDALLRGSIVPAGPGMAASAGSAESVNCGLGYARQLVMGDPRKRVVYSEDSSVTFRRAHDPASEVVHVVAAEVLRPHIGPVLFDVVRARSAVRFAVNRYASRRHVAKAGYGLCCFSSLTKTKNPKLWSSNGLTFVDSEGRVGETSRPRRR